MKMNVFMETTALKCYFYINFIPTQYKHYAITSTIKILAGIRHH